jgi:hypothetical protein
MVSTARDATNIIEKWYRDHFQRWQFHQLYSGGPSALVGRTMVEYSAERELSRVSAGLLVGAFVRVADPHVDLQQDLAAALPLEAK